VGGVLSVTQADTAAHFLMMSYAFFAACREEKYSSNIKLNSLIVSRHM
jgi:hypothetical protein